MVEFNGLLGYALTVAEPSVTGNRSPNHSTRRASAPRQALFSCLSPLYGGLRGEPEKAAGVLVGRSANPALIRRLSFRSEIGGLQILLGVLL